MTPAEIKALWRESNIHQLDDFEGLYKFVQRVLGIGRAEAFREVLELSNNRVLNDWLRRSLSDEEERAKS